MDIGLINALHVEEDSEDVGEDVVVKADEEVVADDKEDNRSMLLWQRRYQKFPKLGCNYLRGLPQCPDNRETS